MAKASDLGVESVLDVVQSTFGLDDGEVFGDEYKIHCPNPDHDDREPSCGINLVTGYWNCFACVIGGDLLDLGKRILGVPQRQVREMLRPSTPEALLATVQRRLAAIQPSDRQRRASQSNITLPGPYQDEPLDELRRRRFTDDTLRSWGVRFVIEQELEGKRGTFTIYNSLAIPIRDARGRLLAWCYRATAASPAWQQDRARYLYTPGFPISEVWFGLDHLGDAADVNVVEGALDTMWVSQCGFPALGLLGSQMGNRKVMELQRFHSVTLFADRDNAGAQWVRRIGTDIGSRTQVFVVLYDKRIVRTYIDPEETDRKKAKLDPQMLAPIDVELLQAAKIPWHQFVRRLAS